MSNASPGDLYSSGQLSQAIDELTEAVRNHPTDFEKRGFLSELLCVKGTLERADAQLAVLEKQDPKTAPGVALIRQLVRAAQHREQFWREGRIPSVLQEPSEAMSAQFRAIVEARQPDGGSIAELLGSAEEKRVLAAGSHRGEAFEDFRDVDDFCGGNFEVLTSTGKYYWIPVDRVAELRPRKPERPLDLCWLPVEMDVVDGPEGVVYLPTTYISMVDEVSDECRLARTTDWTEFAPEVFSGVGQRMFLVGDDALGILELGDLVFGKESV